MKRLFIILALAVGAEASAQQPDIYGEKRDSLNAMVFTASGAGNFLSKGRDIRTEVITAAGLCKMACCNLAESFENSASVTVGYSDAVTGARQIRLLGQSGIYTQMLDENRPVMRGLSAPFGLNYIPGQWLESIQIAKGVTSVINGVESMTGQINMEHRKPTDEKPLYVQASFMNDTKADLNVISALQLDEQQKWSTVILGHVDGNFKEMDHNGDGFMDDPRQLQFSLSNRWLYFNPDGIQVRFGVRGIQDRRTGGQMSTFANPWRSDILNRSLGAYAKVGMPTSASGNSSIAAIVDYTYQSMQSDFTTRAYNAGQHSAFVNVLYQNQENESHHYTVGFSEMFDRYDETFLGASTDTRLNDLGVFGEYTFRDGDVFSAIVGLRGDWYNKAGFRLSPRLTLKWKPADWLVVRANGGRGLRYSTPVVDNFGVLSTGKAIGGAYMEHPLEESWTFGGNATWYIGGSSTTYLSVDFFRTQFKEQMLVDYSGERNISFYRLSGLENGKSYTNNIQVDFGIEPLPRFTITLTGRYTDARQTLLSQTSDIKPMTSRFKGVLNLQYATNLQKWIFDFTASVNGPCRMWDFMGGGESETYPLLYAQVTKRFRGFDIYIGGENLTNYRQKDPILYASTPLDDRFDASCVWGPLSGIKVYAGVRLTLWKTAR